jgi:large subunit ribosomal protein L10
LAITRDKKHQMVAEYSDRLSASQALILADYRGLTVAEITDLRGRLREVNGAFQVVKNTLFKLALEQANAPVPEDLLAGPVAVGYCLGEVPPVAKALVDFAREFEALSLTGAIVGTQVLDAAGVQALADLPPREVLLAQVVGAVQAPLSSVVGVVTAPLRELVQVLQARSEQAQQAAA